VASSAVSVLDVSHPNHGWKTIRLKKTKVSCNVGVLKLKTIENNSGPIPWFICGQEEKMKQ
jgi:hypothetical protein